MSLILAVALGASAVAPQQSTMAPPAPPTAAPMPPRGRRGADPDGDGTVTRADFLAQAAARFDRMDANRDGRLDPDERGAFRGRGGRRGGGSMPVPPAPPVPPVAPAAPGRN